MVHEPPAIIDPCKHHARMALAAMIAACSMAVLALVCAVFMLWMVMSEQKTKLYEADNVVCASQPFAMTCFERKPR